MGSNYRLAIFEILQVKKMRFPTASEREKRAQLLELIDQGLISVTLDARRPGVQVPAQLAKNPALVLNLSRNFHLDILEFEPLVIKANLSFGGVRFLCVLPYEAIYLASGSGKQLFFFNDAPQEIKSKYQQLYLQMQAQQSKQVQASQTKPSSQPSEEPQESDDEAPDIAPAKLDIQPKAPAVEADEADAEMDDEDDEDEADEDKLDGEEDDAEEESDEDSTPWPPKGKPHLRLV